MRRPTAPLFAVAGLALCVIGLPRTAEAVAVGDLVLSELMIKSSSTVEWIEIFNASGQSIDLSACSLREGTDTSDLGAVTIGAGGYGLFSSGGSCVVYNDEEDCSRGSDGGYSGITLNDTSQETLEILCDGTTVIDSVTYNWADFDADCSGNGICSVNLDPGAMTASDNDAWTKSWCVPPPTVFEYDSLTREMVSTPGTANECPTAGPSCGPGDAIFSEFMIAPTSASREWFEVKVTTGSGCDLHGCTLQEGPFDTITEDNLTSEEWDSHVIDAPGNVLSIESGGYALFAKTVDTVAGIEGESDAIEADYSYKEVSLGNSEAGYMHLLCNGTLVDTASYDWERFEDSCQGLACSVNLGASAEDDASNDDLSQWCLPPEEPIYPASDDDRSPFIGTPGMAGACMERSWPVAGELLFTELMVAPISSDEGDSFPEWFELSNFSNRSLELTGCRLERTRYDDDTGEIDGGATTDYTFGSEGQGVMLSAGAVQVFSKTKCIDGREAEGGTCTRGELLYSSVSFSNSSKEDVALWCPTGAPGEALVDLAGYDMTRTGLRSGHALQYYAGDVPEETSNDEPTAWCEAGYDLCVDYLVTDENECNYGTPGSHDPCTTGQVEVPESGPACRCSAAEAPSAGAAAALLLGIGLPWVHRRRRG